MGTTGRGMADTTPGQSARGPSLVVVLVLLLNVAAVALVLTLRTGWVEPPPIPGPWLGACGELTRVVAEYPESPTPQARPHPLATHPAQTDVDRDLQELLLDDVPHGTYTHTSESYWNLDGHASSQHNPDARQIAEAHGFVRQVSRAWTDEQGNTVSHVIVQLSSPRDARSFNRRVAEYSCQFADEVWAHPLDDAGLPAIGQRIRHETFINEQVSWARAGRRHSLSVRTPEGTGRDLLEQLLPRTHGRDDGSAVVLVRGW